MQANAVSFHFWIDCYNLSKVYERQIFLKAVVHVIIIDQKNTSNRY